MLLELQVFPAVFGLCSDLLPLCHRHINAVLHSVLCCKSSVWLLIVHVLIIFSSSLFVATVMPRKQVALRMNVFSNWSSQNFFHNALTDRIVPLQIVQCRFSHSSEMFTKLLGHSLTYCRDYLWVVYRLQDGAIVASMPGKQFDCLYLIHSCELVDNM